MTQADITIVDYGVGNVLSVARAVTQAGGRPNLSSNPAEIAHAERLILPGVGAFGDCIQALRARPGLEMAIRDFAASGRPMLGICVGMQVLFDVGEEFGEHRGLGLIPGRVRAIPAKTTDGAPQKVPHIGWSPLSIPDHRSLGWTDTILAEIQPGGAFYSSIRSQLGQTIRHIASPIPSTVASASPLRSCAAISPAPSSIPKKAVRSG
ncbi:imidazole glycerol phosphate synthase subunit HisH [Magnetospirillum fulvum]|uniref:Imidazole glycerol phosphate synthase subunit HisH n=1 Tax=Magnetospirillum fulvum MGU-K5 TaxID=1316936 RepID=S9SCB7_MAGFU|nr:imidazole glycerol phosphate synthase subunit HisH [Magnetospirillum fulvum]EPY01723.1 imidazole glycerol phosphate synthase subunit HisH [Magnetospirillum fulvum MGU-K5]